MMSIYYSQINIFIFKLYIYNKNIKNYYKNCRHPLRFDIPLRPSARSISSPGWHCGGTARSLHQTSSKNRVKSKKKKMEKMKKFRISIFFRHRLSNFDDQKGGSSISTSERG